MLIELETLIRAPRDRVFDLARSVDLHLDSASRSREKAVAGKISGLLSLGDSITWEATHFAIRQRLTVRITAFERSEFFVDVMTHGPFKRLEHRHQFLERPENSTLMRDHFDFASPLGILGRCADLFILKSHLRRFLIARNDIIKQTAEGKDWENYL